MCMAHCCCRSMQTRIIFCLKFSYYTRRVFCSSASLSIFVALIWVPLALKNRPIAKSRLLLKSFHLSIDLSFSARSLSSILPRSITANLYLRSPLYAKLFLRIPSKTLHTVISFLFLLTLSYSTISSNFDSSVIYSNISIFFFFAFFLLFANSFLLGSLKIIETSRE